MSNCFVMLMDKPFKSHTNKLGNTSERMYDF